MLFILDLFFNVHTKSSINRENFFIIDIFQEEYYENLISCIIIPNIQKFPNNFQHPQISGIEKIDFDNLLNIVFFDFTTSLKRIIIRHYKRFNKSEIFGCKENGSYEDEEMVHGHRNEIGLGFHYVYLPNLLYFHPYKL